MTCEVCEHCRTPFCRDEGVTVHGRFSYHKRCHKCYVCSETNLHNAEVFKGVIFCSSCSQRIFQGCSTARRTKNTRQKRSPIRHKRLDRARPEWKVEDNRTGVIELAELAGSSTSGSHTEDAIHDKSSKIPALSTELTLQVAKETNVDNPVKSLKKDSIEMGMTTDVTQELLKQINCPVVTKAAYKYQGPKHRPRNKGDNHINNFACSDLRIAELGASTEIANMALRKKSELPVIIKSDIRMKRTESFTLSVLNQESDTSGDAQDWLDSPYSTINAFTKTQWMDGRIGSIIKLPYKCFKRRILDRSSLVSVLMSTKDDKLTILKFFKLLFDQDVIAEHHGRGLKKLYPTINRKKVPHRLGWLELVSKVSQMVACKHYKGSHSYRCMRSHVMKLAGPTNSELACFRNKVKKFIAPSFLRRLGTVKRKQRAIMMTQACGCSETIECLFK